VNIRATKRDLGAVTVVDLSGRITLGEGSAAMRQLLGDLVSLGRKKIILNLAYVEYIDSSGLGELVRGYSSVAKAGGDLKLLHLTQRVHDLLQITKLFTVFDVHSDEAAALASFT
jgi:anti-sigma B factor antagonist